MRLISFARRYKNIMYDDDGIIETDIGECVIPNEKQIEAICDFLKITDDATLGPANVKVDYFEYRGWPHVCISNLKNWKHVYYTFNLFTLRPTRNSPSQRIIPKVIADQLRKHIQYDAPCNDLIPSKDELKKSLFTREADSVAV